MTLHRWLLPAVVFAQLALQGPARAQTAPDSSTDWPRQIDSVAGTIVVYQPQPEALQGNTLTARTAFSLTPKGKTDPVFGAMWFTAEVSIDRTQGLVKVLSAKVTRVRLPDATPNDEKSFAAEIEGETPKWNLSLSLEGLTAALTEVQEERTAADDLKAEPPRVLFATEPTVLVVLEGQPIRRPIENSGIESVVNTPYPLFYEPGSKRYYLTNGALWYQTSALLAGPWEVIPKPPQAVSDVVMKGDKQDQSAPAPKDTAPPGILVATEPTELIVSQGPPNFAPVNGTQLLYLTNSEDNVFRDLASQKLFIVLSGRWYAAASFDGPWTFVRSNQLPADFARIPPTSPKGDVLAFVSGTPQARDAVMDAQVPTTAEVRRDAPGPTIQYDGQPSFQSVPGTTMSSAVNTPASVLLIDGVYYACVDAVWYVGQGPQGPWTVATAVPQEVQKIPPSSPLYNVKYVTIYQATPDSVYVGYTPGYLGAYTWNGAVVYGTGYAYAPYVSPLVYYPRPVTWGFGASYNPWTGWSYGVGVGAGFLYFGTRWGGPYYRPAWRSAYGGGWYGPGGFRPPPPHPAGGGWYGGYRGAGPRPGYPGGAYHPAQPSLYQRSGNANAVVSPHPFRGPNPGAPRPGPTAGVPGGARQATGAPVAGGAPSTGARPGQTPSPAQRPSPRVSSNVQSNPAGGASRPPARNQGPKNAGPKGGGPKPPKNRPAKRPR
jgi:hypothetical protein